MCIKERKFGPPNIDGLPQVELSQVSRLLYRLPRNELIIKPGDNAFVIVSGPSGVGKDSVVDLLPTDRFARVRTCTTRPVDRSAEEENDPYIRLTPDEFQQSLQRGEFIEEEPYGDYHYGTRRKELEEIFRSGRTPVLRVEPEGAGKYMQGGVDVPEGFMPVYFYLLPEDKTVIEQRLHSRDVEPYSDPVEQQKGLEKVDKRLNLLPRDLGKAHFAHYWLVNPDGQIDAAVKELTGQVGSLLAE